MNIWANPVLRDECPACRLNWSLFPPARVDQEVEIDGRKTFRPGPLVRCVECKRTFDHPLEH